MFSLKKWFTYFKSRFILTLIVSSSFLVLGSILNVEMTSVGTLTIFPLIFFCPPTGAWKTFIKGMRGDSSRHSVSYKPSSSFGTCGKLIPFSREHGGTFIFFRYPRHALQMYPLVSMSLKQDSVALHSGTLTSLTLLTDF